MTDVDRCVKQLVIVMHGRALVSSTRALRLPPPLRTAREGVQSLWVAYVDGEGAGVGRTKQAATIDAGNGR